ncbi:AAC(3) family N-acetyltransferase [Radiobacillus kanasensis]|uniref:aminoglycoside N(3)-acetyltransferase n=1 Tax=Radiobacillus kanasensis TaxID=2844358 RepID=UPI001E366A66|nr:AAC(3) family N-acetyltransferase [Radiobacillus kanasensis]UFU00391.1 AAC(3) family N-acetyltransferase [Radiobacillus kanasensis]
MENVIKAAVRPRTRHSLKADLDALGVQKGMTVIVHSSLSSLGWVNGGEVAVIQALQDVITDEGTIVMPAQTPTLSDPAEWGNPPVPEDWWDEIKETMPAYEEGYTPTYGMGKIVEAFRSFPSVKRSSHPMYSFLAWGKNRDTILANHSLENGLGEESPLKKLYDMEASVLLIGVGYDSNTSFHLAEYRIQNQQLVPKGSPMMENGMRVWKNYMDIEFREELFEDLGNDFENELPVKKGYIGSGLTKLFSVREAVDYAAEWLENYDDKIKEHKGS